MMFSKNETKDILLAMEFAETASKMSKAERTKVGCVIITPSRGFYVGVNGTLPGESNVCEHDGVTHDGVIHAEMNALDKMNREGISTFGCIAVMTLSPCERCLTRIRNVGIKAVVFRDSYRKTEHLCSDKFPIFKYSDLLKVML